jgi:uncharacterized protein with ATP-grasp and redox domains
MNSPAFVEFIPGRTIRYDPASEILVKGRVSGPTQGTRFEEVYADTPVVAGAEALTLIAGMILGSAPYPASDLVRCPAGSYGRARIAFESPLWWTDLLTRPFRISECADEKIADSLAWMHTHLSGAAARGGRPAIGLFRAFALLLKADDYYLARRATPNDSMAIQRRIIAALAPGALRDDQERTRRANAAAMELLEHMDPRRDVLRACLLSAFAGTTWFGDWPQGSDPETIGGGLGSVIAGSHHWGIDSTERFASSVLTANRMVAILDDSGEAVFDLALLQVLLADNPRLDLTIMAHLKADGVNVTAAEINALLRNSYFAEVEGQRRAGLLRILAVDQDLPSFEPEFFSPQQWQAIDAAEVVLVKGASFYETTALGRPAFYCFVVHTLSSRLLTSHPAGAGIFLHTELPLPLAARRSFANSQP